MKDNVSRMKTCPHCGRTFCERPAVSRADNITLICPDCGTREALTSLGICPEEQEKIIRTIHRSRNNLP